MIWFSISDITILNIQNFNHQKLSEVFVAKKIYTSYERFFKPFLHYKYVKKMEEQQEPISALLAEFGTRLNEIEEKQRLVKDRILLIGENLVSTKEDYDKQILEFKRQINELILEVKSIKQLNKRIIGEMDNFARKTELEIIERQIKMFQPLEFARIKDIKKIIQEELAKTKNN